MEATAVKLDSELPEEYYREVHSIQVQLGRKFEGMDTLYHDERELLIDAANKYAETYSGTFAFMLDMAKEWRKNQFLRPNMMKGVLNCITAEWRRYLNEQEKARKDTAWAVGKNASEPITPVNAFRIPEGRYTVVRSNGDYHTLWIADLSDEKCDRYRVERGSRIIKYLNGPDNMSSYAAFGWVTPTGQLRPYGRFDNETTLIEDAKNLLSMDRDGVLNTTEAYALRSGRCSQCGRELTVEESILFGMGPICRAKFGI